MYGDTEIVDRQAGALREQAEELRLIADHLSARVDALAWNGRAAESMRRRVQDRTTHLRAAARDHDGAADAVGVHARAVRDVQESVAAIEQRHRDVVAEARTRTARAAQTGAAPAPDDAAVLAFTPPPRGHRDWLTAEIPGV